MGFTYVHGSGNSCKRNGRYEDGAALTAILPAVCNKCACLCTSNPVIETTRRRMFGPHMCYYERRDCSAVSACSALDRLAGRKAEPAATSPSAPVAGAPAAASAALPDVTAALEEPEEDGQVAKCDG